MELRVAVITRPHGLKGDVALDVRTDMPQERLVAGAELRTSAGLTLTVRRAWRHSGRWLISFEGVRDRDAAEALRGVELLVDAAESDEEDAWYAHELAGLEARLRDGAIVGEIAGLEHLPAQDALIVREPSGARTLVPLVTTIVPEVNVAGGYVVLDPPGGMLADQPLPEDEPAE